MNYAEGIYFGMPEDEYHNIPYFSRSVGENVLVDAEEAWHKSPRNPDLEPQETTPQMELGKAIHCMMLEPEIFRELYVKTPTPEDYQDKTILTTTTDIADFLVRVGEKKSGLKAELISRAMPYLDPKTHVLWDNVMEEFRREVAEHGRRVLSASDIEILSGIKKSLDQREEIKSIISKGYSEVTVIWKDSVTGVMCKCRLDYVRPEAIGEVKSFSLKRKKNMYKAMCDEIVYERYNVQYVVYHDALEQVIESVNKGKAKVHGDVDPEWLQKFLAIPDKQFFFIFVRTQAPFQQKAIEMRKAFSQGASKNVYYEEGKNLFRIELNQYARCEQLYGDLPWREEKEVETLMDEHIPNIMYQGYNA